MILIESGLSRIASHMKDHDSGTISASRDEFSYKENKQRSLSLKAKLLSLGYSVTPVRGSYIQNYNTSDAVEVKESSFFVVDIKDKGKLELDLRALGEEFKQDSILFIPVGGNMSVLWGTNHIAEWPGYGKKIVFNSRVLGKNGEFMTKIKGRPFIFESVEEEYPAPNGYFGKWGVSVVAKRDWKEIEL